MGRESPGPSSALSELKRRLGGVLVRSRVDYTDDLFTILKFFINLRWERGWSASRMAQEWQAQLRQTSGTRRLFTLYLHFPYCKARCSYCFTNSRVICGQEPIERYIEEIQKEIRFFAPTFKDVAFHDFAVGGGTPSLMSVDQLKRFCGPAFEAFQLTEDGSRSIELNPADTDAAKLEALRALGFKRVSFGVQSMTPETLRLVNRRQSFEGVQAAIHGAKAAGFDSVSADVIFGMVDEPLESFLDSFRRVAEIRPSTIMVCTLSLTDKYMRATRTTREDYLRYYKNNLIPAFEGVREISRQMGYILNDDDLESGEWGAWDATVPITKSAYSREDGTLPAYMLGLGRGSRSQIFGRWVYERDFKRFDSEEPIFQAAPVSLKYEMVHFIVTNLEHGSRLSYSAFQERFGKDVREVFAFELKILKAFGRVRFDAEGFRYLSSGVPHRVFWASVFALDAMPSLPCAKGLFDGNLRARLEAELVEVDLRPAAA